MRIARIFKEKCEAPKKCEYICMKVCPLNRSGKKCIEIDEKTKKPIIHEEICVGCGLCVKKCPFEAIKIENTPEEIEKDLIHSYGRNQFRLFRLPIIKKGITSLIGENALGKTTCLKIFIGEIIPNFGEEKIDKKEVIKRLRGSELQNYFKELYSKKVKYAIKVQNIDELRSNIKVEDFLGKEIIEKYKLETLKDRKLNQLSGGELQKVIIIKTLESNADFIFLDEPTAYLDIKQRLSLVKELIKSKEKKYIVVVDHDLIFVDAISDILFIFYGKPGIFGVVSKPMSIREGINEYLRGYLKKENIRIRDKEIIFEKKQEIASSKKVLCKWKKFKVKLDGFMLEAEEGEIYEEEIIGIIGENGIGKTTFVRALAGCFKEINPTDKEIKVAYKPQYISPSKEIKNLTVIEFLEKSKLIEKIKEDFYRVHIINPLKIRDIIRKKIGNLSGGELQRFSIVITLLQEADLYLLDEPTTYLDVEMRIRLYRILKDFVKTTKKAILVVDHDLSFIDYISDRVIYVKGIPGKQGKILKLENPRDAINSFLKDIEMTFRRDEITRRLRYNKEGSRKDLEQRKEGKYLEE